MTELDRTGLTAQINSLLADNSDQEIDAPDIRSVLNDLVESAAVLKEKSGFERPQYYDVETIAFSATPSVDADNSSGSQEITLTGNITDFQITGGTHGQWLDVVVIHDGASTVAWNAAILGTAPTLGASAGQKTLLSFYHDGMNWRHAGALDLGS